MLSLAALGVAGCASEGYTNYPTGQYDQYGRPVYPQTTVQYDQYGRPVYAQQYPATQPAYSQYPGQPVYSAPAPGYAYGPTGYSATDYVYYPDEEVYYSPVRREYIYPDHGSWVRGYRPPPYFRASDFSVHLSLGDDPVRHHHEIERQYPRHWRPHDRDWDRDGRR